MCGRTACALDSNQLKDKCLYRGKDGKERKPEWKLNEDRYKPGHNVAPQSYCPLLIRGKHLGKDEDRVLCAMKWGLVPTWMKENKMSFNMNNARSDTILEKRSYKIPLHKGQRCVVLAEGFYEWKTTAKNKQPYFIHTKENGKLLAMAGIFEKAWVNDDDLYSFSIITVESDEKFGVIHHRMPAFLETDSAIDAWLDYEQYPDVKDAVNKIIKSDSSSIQWYPVSKFVSNSRNQGEECRAKISAEEVEKLAVASASRTMSKSALNMMSWLKSAPKSSEGTSQNKKRSSGTKDIQNYFAKKPKQS